MSTCNPVRELHQRHQEDAAAAGTTLARYELHLEGDPAAVLRALKATLKRIGRDHGIRCASVAELPANQAPAEVQLVNVPEVPPVEFTAALPLFDCLGTLLAVDAHGVKVAALLAEARGLVGRALVLHRAQLGTKGDVTRWNQAAQKGNEP